MATQWRPLPLAAGKHGQLPPLLISTHFTTTAYTILLTDLTSIWSESLDRRAIIKRSIEEDTSIDPSEDADQFRQFLDRIKLGLAGAKSTGLSLSAPPGAKSASAVKLELQVTAKLPGGLRPLKWPIFLSAAPQSVLTAQLVLPLLHAQNARLKELDDLVGLLKDKDHVIHKLVDKLEATGAQLGHILPAAAGKGGRPISRKLAEERVKGLGPFDYEKWSARVRLSVSEDGLGSVTQRTFGSNLDNVVHDFEAEIPKKWGKWWDNLDGLQIVNDEDDEEVNGAAGEVDTTPEEEDDFQVQATPPSEEGQKTSPNRPIHSSDHEDDLDDISQRSAIPDSLPLSQPKHQPQPKKLGLIGRPKAPPKPTTEGEKPSPAPISSVSHAAAPDSDTDTASEEEAESHPSPAPKTKSTTPRKPSPSPVSTPKAKKTLGKIVGKKREETPPSPPKPTSKEETTLPERTQKPKHKLGIIGHKAKVLVKDGGDGAEGSVADGKGKEKIKVPSLAPEETAEEKADRKREELKRQLEKPKTPIKKKRRF